MPEQHNPQNATFKTLYESPVSTPSSGCDQSVFELGQFIPSVYHFNMLADEARLHAFKQAIAHTVWPGASVLELGGGTGVLSHFAAQHGASVLCIEKNPELVLHARRILQINPFGNQVNVLQADAMDYLPASPVDIVICEMVHVGMLREKQLEVIDSFKRRYRSKFSEPLPCFIPEAFFQAIQPVQQCFDFGGYLAPTPCYQDPLLEQTRTLALGEPVLYQAGSYHEDFSLRCDWEGTLAFNQCGQFNAIRVITKNILTVLEIKQRTIDWTSQYLIVPINLPIQVEPGQKAFVRFAYKAGDPIDALHPIVSQWG